jgi:hypothetical protein
MRLDRRDRHVELTGGWIMKRIVQIAVVVFACSAGAAWSQQSEEISAQQQEATTVAQVGSGSGERVTISREEAKPRKTGMHDLMDLAADGVFPSRGGPLDD